MSLRVLGVVTMCLGLWLGAWSCGPSHCGYNGGDTACYARDASLPYCNLCIQDNDGCVAAAPVDAGCVLITDSGPLPETTSPASTAMTVVAEPTTTGGVEGSTSTGMGAGTTSTGPDTTTTTEDSTSTTTTTGDESTASTTADDTTSTTTTGDESTSTTADDTTGPPPPMCGNDVVEGMEPCDGSDLAGKTCADFPGVGEGTLVCTDVCQFDLAGCCLANGQACGADGDCCGGNCAFDLLMFKNICK